MTISGLEASVKGAVRSAGVAIGANGRAEVVTVGIEKAAGLSTVGAKPGEVFTFDILLALIAAFFDT